MAVKERFSRNKGQMTVELVVVLPVLLAVACIALNVSLFLSSCAQFDRVFRNSVCTYAVSPAYQQTSAESCLLIEEALNNTLLDAYIDCEVVSYGSAYGFTTYVADLKFTPTLFGVAPVDSFFGLSLPQATHQSRLVVDCYKPGVFL